MVLVRLVRQQSTRECGPRSVSRFEPEVHPRSKLTKCPEQEEQLKLLGPLAVGCRQKGV